MKKAILLGTERSACFVFESACTEKHHHKFEDSSAKQALRQGPIQLRLKDSQYGKAGSYIQRKTKLKTLRFLAKYRENKILRMSLEQILQAIIENQSSLAVDVVSSEYNDKPGCFERCEEALRPGCGNWNC